MFGFGQYFFLVILLPRMLGCLVLPLPVVVQHLRKKKDRCPSHCNFTPYFPPNVMIPKDFLMFRESQLIKGQKQQSHCVMKQNAACLWWIRFRS